MTLLVIDGNVHPNVAQIERGVYTDSSVDSSLSRICSPLLQQSVGTSRQFATLFTMLSWDTT
jgi:hypothetical protein